MPRNLNDRFEIRLTAADKRTIELKAKEARMTLAAWIRHRLMLDEPTGAATNGTGTPANNSTPPVTTDASEIARSLLWD